jgi:hypothetical protein
VFPYSKLNHKTIIQGLMYIADRRGKGQGNHITILHNRKFSEHKNDALQDVMRTFVPSNNGTWFFAKDEKSYKDEYSKGIKTVSVNSPKNLPNPIAVGATLTTYIYDGNTINFMLDDTLSRKYPSFGYAIFMDTGFYEQVGENMPAISLHTLRDQALRKNWVSGVGGYDGKTDGAISQAVDLSSYILTGWRGVRVADPYGGFIMKENIDGSQ